MNIKKLITTLISVVMVSSSAAYASGHVKYSVTADNYSEYTEMLTPGMMNMFAAYPDTFRMDVYENGGDCTLDADVLAISQQNGCASLLSRKRHHWYGGRRLPYPR